jgi:A118 family predicted phage portal protein
MSLFQKVKDFFSRGRYNMQTSNLNSILEHPKIAVTQEEYDRIKRNLVYYQSKWDDVQYKNTDGDIKSRPMNHLLAWFTMNKRLSQQKTKFYRNFWMTC